MRRFLFIALLWLISVSCNGLNEKFILSGEIVGAREGEEVMLSYPLLVDGVWYEQNLATKIVEGKFRFEGELYDLSPAHLWFEDMAEVLFFIEPGRMNIRIDRERPYAFELRGVSVREEYEEYREALGEVPQMLHEMNDNLQGANLAWLAAEERGDIAADSLKQRFYDVVSYFRLVRDTELERCHSFLMGHSDYAIAPYLLYYLAFNDAVDDAMLHSMYDSLPRRTRHSSLGLLARQRIELLTRSIGGEKGDTAFVFERKDASGDTIRLRDYLQQEEYVLLDFWASWCGPCIEQAPNVKLLHDKYSNHGFQVVGISTDEDVAAWRGAIERYGLDIYPQVLSAEPSEQELFFDELVDVASAYEVTSIPCFVLIDGKGEVVARWQHFDEQIFEYVKKLFE